MATLIGGGDLVSPEDDLAVQRAKRMLATWLTTLRDAGPGSVEEITAAAKEAAVMVRSFERRATDRTARRRPVETIDELEEKLKRAKKQKVAIAGD